MNGTAGPDITSSDEYLDSDYEIAKCSCQLLDSSIFRDHADYVRKQIVHGLLQVRLSRVPGSLKSHDDRRAEAVQEDSPNVLHIITTILLLDGRRHEETFELMNQEGAFTRLVELIRSQRDDDGLLHRRLLELLYEMSRIQRLQTKDLGR